MTPDDEASYRSVIRERLKPHFDRFSDQDRAESKISLQYCLSKPGTPFRRFIHLLPFPPPRDARQFFVWIWEEFFGSEDYAIDWRDYAEVNDSSRPLKIKFRN